MSNAETKHDFAIGFLIVLAANIAAFITACIFFAVIGINSEFLKGYPVITPLLNTVTICILAELIFFGLVQYLYVALMMARQSEKGNRKITRGMLIGSFFVLGINCCWLVVVVNVLSKF